MSKYLKLSARTTSEWDGTSFLLVELTTKFLDKLKHLIGVVKGLKESEGIDKIVYYSDDAEFFNTDDEISEEYYEIVELDDTEGINRPEQEIRYGHTAITGFEILFVGYGKHTDEEFWGKVSNEFILNLVV